MCCVGCARCEVRNSCGRKCDFQDLVRVFREIFCTFYCIFGSFSQPDVRFVPTEKATPQSLRCLDTRDVVFMHGDK